MSDAKTPAEPTATESTPTEPTKPSELEIKSDAKPAKRGVGWLSLLIAALFGLFYAYYVWAAIAPMVALPNYYIEIGLQQTDVPWWLLVIGLAIPVVVYIAAFFIGLRRSVPAKALIFVLGLAVVAALSLGVIALELVVRTRLLEGIILA